MNKLTQPLPDQTLDSLLEILRGLIEQGRQRALRAVDMVQVQTCWELGRHIVEFEQGGQARADYGKKLLPPSPVKLQDSPNGPSKIISLPVSKK